MDYQNFFFFDICLIICNKLLEKLLQKIFLKKLKGKKIQLFESGQLGQKVSLPHWVKSKHLGII